MAVQGRWTDVLAPVTTTINRLGSDGGPPATDLLVVTMVSENLGDLSACKARWCVNGLREMNASEWKLMQRGHEQSVVSSFRSESQRTI